MPVTIMKPIKIYGHVAGPHPWKVVILLKGLGVPYEIEFLTAEEMKIAPYIDVCPNGRVPTIVDPNHDITLWESGTIIEYLEDMYDQDDKLKYSTFPEKYHQKNWKDYQIAGHDLFLGQKAYFTMFHTDQDISSVHEHYGNMVRWVLGVVERQLATTGHPYLVGDKCTYADLMYIPFHLVLPDKLMRNVSDGFEQEWKETFPRCYEWNSRIVGRESVQQALEEKYRAMDAAGWPR
ncbi:Glutathione S-transferase 2 [Colletotrichum tanaceti]|nr:Glutathione S-transferase 2 [Colletotrichum tanaceti]